MSGAFLAPGSLGPRAEPIPGKPCLACGNPFGPVWQPLSNGTAVLLRGCRLCAARDVPTPPRPR